MEVRRRYGGRQEAKSQAPSLNFAFGYQELQLHACTIFAVPQLDQLYGEFKSVGILRLSSCIPSVMTTQCRRNELR